MMLIVILNFWSRQMFMYWFIPSKMLIAAFVMSVFLSACGGIPIRSIPRLMNLQSELLTLNPAEFKLAVQTDSSLAPPANSVPYLELSIKPERVGGFEPVSKVLPMRFEATKSPAGLSPATKDRQWLTYSFSPESQVALSSLQMRIKKLMAEKTSNGGGSISVGIHQDGMAPNDARLANTRWDSWLQTDVKSGYFELWSGTVADLKAAAQKAKK
jgi:hypothetical protein